MFTSKKLSKLLQENGFAGESEYCYLLHDDGTHSVVRSEDYSNNIKKAYMYDILNDLCVKYAKEMFGEKNIIRERNKKIGQPAYFFNGPAWKYYTFIILEFLQQNKQDEAEDYIIDHCILFK